MEFLTEALTLFSTLFAMMGGASTIMGGFSLFESYSSDNSAEKAKGGRQCFGGLAVILLALAIPRLFTGFMG